MANSGKGKKGSRLTTIITLIVAAVLLLVTQGDDWFRQTNPVFLQGNMVAVHFIDVGQGSCTLIQSGTDGILIDAGEREYADTVIQYINRCGVTQLKYVVATHPHSDHIGALSDVMTKVKTDNIIMPKLSKENTPTTRTYERLLETVQSKKIKAIAAKYGAVYGIENAQIEILGPLQQDENLNNMSVVCKLTAYKTKMMLLGDAENAELKSIKDKGGNFQSDVILMGHHGSSTSVYQPFLDKVGAKVAVISCGKNNDYGHPHRETLSYLNKNKIEIHRTDQSSTIVIGCYEDGYQFEKAA